jgi:AcrR family transcriptional regulator
MPSSTFFNLPDDKRETIIQLAIEEFAENDYQNASISRIVARARIAKGSFYQYFADKKDLLLYLLDLAAQEKMTMLQGVHPPDAQMDLFAYLRWLFKSSAQFELAHPRLSEVAYRAYHGDLPFRDETIVRLKKGGLDYFQHLIQQAITNGDIHPSVDAEVAAFIFNTLLGEFGSFLLHRLGRDGKQRLTDVPAAEWKVVEATFDQLLYILQYGVSADARMGAAND